MGHGVGIWTARIGWLFGLDLSKKLFLSAHNAGTDTIHTDTQKASIHTHTHTHTHRHNCTYIHMQSQMHIWIQKDTCTYMKVVMYTLPLTADPEKKAIVFVCVCVSVCVCASYLKSAYQGHRSDLFVVSLWGVSWLSTVLLLFASNNLLLTFIHLSVPLNLSRLGFE